MIQPYGHHLEFVANADIRPQLRPREKDLQFNKIPRQSARILTFRNATWEHLHFLCCCRPSSLQRAAHMDWGTCLSQESCFQAEGRTDSLGPATTKTSAGQLCDSAYGRWCSCTSWFDLFPYNEPGTGFLIGPRYILYLLPFLPIFFSVLNILFDVLFIRNTRCLYPFTIQVFSFVICTLP